MVTGSDLLAIDAPIHADGSIGIDFVSDDEVAVKGDAAARLDGAGNVQWTSNANCVFALDAS